MKAHQPLIYFGLDEARLSTAQTKQLEQLAEFLLAEENSQLNLRIEGHCDDRGPENITLPLVPDGQQSLPKQMLACRKTG